MKRNNPPFPFEAPPVADTGRRHPMNSLARTLLILLLILILAATGLAWYASVYPIVIRLDRQTLAFNRVADLNYTVNVQQDTFGDSSGLPMDQVYIRDTVANLEILFSYDLYADRDVTWNTDYQIDAVVQICDATDQDIVFLQQSIALLERQEHTAQRNIAVVEEVEIEPARYEDLARQYNPDPNLPVSYRLQVILSLNASAVLDGGSYSLTDQLVMYIPLLEPSMMIERVLPPDDDVIVRQGIDYQLALTPLPFFVYPATAGLTLLLLVLLLLVTRNRHRNRFQRRLKRRLRRVRRTLILIGNKAWEPEWCIRITNFKSLARTARRLKLPVFCYIERRLPLAYFYVQIGENNYCYIYSPDPNVDLTQLEMDADSPSRSADLDEDTIPVLPEDEDLDEELVGIDELDSEPTSNSINFTVPPRRTEIQKDSQGLSSDEEYALDEAAEAEAVEATEPSATSGTASETLLEEETSDEVSDPDEPKTAEDKPAEDKTSEDKSSDDDHPYGRRLF